MRFSLRSVRLLAHLLAAVALATCADAPTGPAKPRAAHVAFAPVFSARALEAAAQLETAGIGVASIRILIHRPGTSEVLADKVIEVKPGETSVTLSLDLTINGSEEQLTAKLQFRDAGGVVLFEGVKNLTVKAGTNAATEVPPTVIDYVGPGAAATELHVAPADTTISTADLLTLRVTAKDASGTFIESPLVLWSSSDSALAVPAAGVVTASGTRGTVTIRAAIPQGPVAEATVHLVPPPATLSVFSGGGQSGIVGSTLAEPFKVRVTAADGGGSPGVAVSFEALAEGASVELATVETDAEGYARTPVTLGTVAGEHTFRATAGTLDTVTITASALPVPATQLVVLSSLADTVRSGLSLSTPLRVQLADSTGKPVAKAGVTITVSAVRLGEMTAPITLGGTTSLQTTAEGIAEFAGLTMTGLEGDVALQVSADSLTPAQSESIYLAYGLVAALAVQPAAPTEPVAATVGEPITAQLWLETLDAAGNRVPHEPVRFVIRAGGATGTVTLDTTIATNGIGELPAASFPVPASSGSYHVEMTVGTPAVASASLALEVASAVEPVMTLVKVAGDAQADTIDALLATTPLVVELRDGSGAPVANQQIVWRAIPTVVHVEGSHPNVMLIADPTLPETEQEWYVDSLSTVTDAQGRAQMHVRLGSSTAHPATVQAIATGQALSADFDLTVKAGAVDWITILQQPDTIRAGLRMEPVLKAQLVDAYDNPVPLGNVAIVVSPYWYGEQYPTTASTLQSITADDESTTYPRRQTRPTRIRSSTPTTTTTTAGTMTRFNPGATAAVSESGIAVTGDTVYTDANGTATFTDLTVGGAAGAYSLDLIMPSRELWGDWAYVELTPGVVAKLEVHPSDYRTEVTPGDSVTIETRVVDAWNNHVAEDAATRTITWSTPAGAFVPAATSTTSGGYATITFVAPTTLGTITSVTATTDGLSGEPASLSGTTGSMTVVEAVPAAIQYGAATALEAGDRQVRMIGEPLEKPLLARVLDEQGQPIPNLRIVWRTITQNAYTDADTTVTDANGLTSLLPTLVQDSVGHGYVFEAVPLEHQYLHLRFQAAARPDSSFTHVWFGAPYAASSTSDWNTVSSWSTTAVPTATSSVLVPQWNGYFTAPQLTGPVTVADYVSAGATFAPVDLNTHVLTVTGRIEATNVTGTGEVHLAGTQTRAYLTAAGAKVVVPAGASATVDPQLHAAALDVQGSLLVSDATVVLNGGDLTVGQAGRLDLPGTGSVASGRHVILEAGATLTTGSGYIQFAQNFEQRGTAPLVIDSLFQLMGSFTEVPGTITVPAGSSLGGLMLMGTEGKGSSVTIGSGVAITGDLLAYDVAVAADSLTVAGTTQVDSASSFANVGVLLSRSTSWAPLFYGAPAKKTILDASTYAYYASRYQDLEVRRDLTLSGNRLTVNGNLFVSGQAAGIRMSSSVDSVIVGGAAHFAGANSAQFLAQGTLVLRGDFMQVDPDQKSAGSFRPGPELEVILAGTAQKVSFQTPSDAAGTGSYFSRVRVEPEASVTQASAVYVAGRLDARGAWTADDYGPEGVRLLDISGSGAELRVENVMRVSRLNLYSGDVVRIIAPGTLDVYQCYDGGATIEGTMSCVNRSTAPLLATLSQALGATSPLRSLALAVAAVDRRHGE